MTKIFKDFEISDDKKLLQKEKVHSLLKEAYWCRGKPQKTVAAAIDASLCFGVYKDGTQVGFGRVVTDGATFAWICDVIIDEGHRGHGL